MRDQEKDDENGGTPAGLKNSSQTLHASAFQLSKKQNGRGSKSWQVFQFMRTALWVAGSLGAEAWQQANTVIRPPGLLHPFCQ